MSSNDSKGGAWLGDEEVAQAYEHAGFHEEPPAKVDRAILAAARGRRRRGALTPWLAPVALAATVLLSLSVVIRLGMISVDDPDLSGLGSGGLEEAEQAVDESENRPAAQSGGPRRASSAVESGQSSAVERATTAPEALRALESAPSEPVPAPVSQTQELAPGAASSSDDADRASTSCEALRDEPEAWLQCIVALLDSGAAEFAASELSDFRASHPDYPLPAELEIP